MGGGVLQAAKGTHGPMRPDCENVQSDKIMQLAMRDPLR